MKAIKALSGNSLKWEGKKYSDLLRRNKNESNLEIDFLKSEDPLIIEKAISQLQKKVDYAREIIALAIYKLLRDGKYIELGFRSREEYLKKI